MAKEPTNYTQGYSKATVSSHASRTVQSDAAFLLPHLKPTDHILDVGCGPGTITVGFGALVPSGSVIGIDISEDVLEQARRLASPAGDGEPGTQGNAPGHPSIEFQRADLLSGLPYPDNEFDVVFSSQLFPHLATPEVRLSALSEMRRVLKPGGILATRDAAELRFYPRQHDLDRLLVASIAKALRNGEPDACFPGGDMPAVYRAAGFDAASGKIQAGAGTTVHSGREARKWYADRFLEKLDPGDPYRESWARAGVTEDEIASTREALSSWARNDDAWYVALQAEILGWK